MMHSVYVLQPISFLFPYFVQNWGFIKFFYNLCVCFIMWPSVSCCFSHIFYLCCCYSSSVSCYVHCQNQCCRLASLAVTLAVLSQRKIRKLKFYEQYMLYSGCKYFRLKYIFVCAVNIINSCFIPCGWGCA